jgi:SAM-dependent methyltransferase
MPASVFKPSFFEREDESADGLFYTAPRLVVHIDDYAIEAARRLYAELLPPGGAVLDLMSSWRSHLPDSDPPRRVVGLGMNAEEMRDNPQLSEHVVHDLNRDPHLPFADAEFDAAIVTVSVQYLTRPVDVFRDVRRVLRDGAPFIVTYSNRMFPTKAVRVWRALDDRERAVLIRAYFRESGGWGEVSAEDRSIDSGGQHDPLFAVWASRAGDDTAVAGAPDQV